MTPDFADQEADRLVDYIGVAEDYYHRKKYVDEIAEALRKAQSDGETIGIEKANLKLELRGFNAAKEMAAKVAHSMACEFGCHQEIWRTIRALKPEGE